MAQTGFTPIVTYNTATATTVPSAANLAQGELAVNVTDKKLYTKDSGGNVVLLASNGGDVTGPASSTNLAIPTFSGTGGKTLLNNSGVTITAGVITATGFSGPLTGNVTGNVSGSSGSCTGNAATVTTNANLTGPITSVGNATSIASQTGTGTKFVVDTSPTLVTPVLGVATATSINKMAITAPATSSTLAVADGKTLTASNSLTLAGTDGTTQTFPTTSATIARTDAAQTFTGAQTFGETILGTNAAKVFNSGGVSIGNTTDPGASNLSVSGALFAAATSNQFYTGFTGAGSIIRTASVSTNTKLLEVCGGTDTSVPTFAVFYNANNTAMNSANSVVKIGLMAATARSINAAGTINAFGADYAEYMTKAGDFTVAKGDVVGINADGKLTNVFADAVSFAVKSTSPSYVGGDVWGVGFEDNPDGLEEARKKVDRIAFAGQVPVNVLGATAGQYIIPVNDNGAIKGQAISNPTLEQYMAAIGKVIAVENDGRANIIVKII